MVRYIALLRGINVGGNNKIAMPKLKAVFEQAGFSNVITSINSGNVIFDSELDEGTAQAACETLTARIQARVRKNCLLSQGSILVGTAGDLQPHPLV